MYSEVKSTYYLLALLKLNVLHNVHGKFSDILLVLPQLTPFVM